MRKFLLAIVVLLLPLFLYATATQPPTLVDRVDAITVPDDPEAWIRQKEQAIDRASHVVAGAEKRIRWQDPESRERTAWSVVYFHGYSASRQEIAPVPELVADALGANLFESRLSGHGIETEPLYHATAEDWIADGVEGLAIGSAIGERIAIIGTSTGASVALALAGRPEMKAVSAMILISPNFAPQDSTAEILTWPGGLQVARLTVGESRSWEPCNELQGRYWTTTYPMESLMEMMRLVKYVRSKLPMSIEQRLLTIYSSNDQVVDPQRTLLALQQIEAPQKILHEIRDSADEGQHVLIGDILSPGSSLPAAAVISRFILESGAPAQR